MSTKEEKIKLFLQFLRSKNYHKTFEKLQQQSQIQLDPSNLLKITQSIKTCNYTELESILEQYVDNQTKNQCMLLLLEQLYIQLIKTQRYQEAVQILRNQISRFCQGMGYMNQSQMNNRNTYTALWFLIRISNQKDNNVLIDEIISLCFQQLGLFEPNRLITLIQQAKSNEVLECKWHDHLHQDYRIQKKHSCTQEFNHVIKVKNVSLCSFSDNGEYKALAIGQSIVVYQINQIESIKEIDKLQEVHSKKITNLLFSPCSKYIGSSSEDYTVFIYNFINKRKYRLQGHNAIVKSFNFVLCDPSRKKQKNEYDIYSISTDGWLYEWNENERRGGLKIEEKLIDIHSHQSKELMLIVSQNKITLYQLYSKNQIIQTSSNNLININSQVNKQFEQMIVYVNDYLPQLYLYCVQTLQIIKILGVYSEKSINSFKYHFGWFNNYLIAAGTDSGQLVLWHVEKSEKPIEILQVSEQNKEIACLRFHPTSHELLIYVQQKTKKQSTQLERQQLQENLIDLFTNTLRQTFALETTGWSYIDFEFLIKNCSI
ncbi:unnamed protein product (macronuclear) [Paramecium tetraurelia]|uniref:Uncharacterized protein n=1 Tax=Paramecium tetraurelia TaxID=5888 RepID=A0EHG5_PARTE|nr:uncharacterized protein GSPATT00027080001 [Paramecium tetraurelia]CAK94756.1 unnamed protein product [Paramecium tetraurelia]|eukprot:XP_001462129.1 hypothetical protein (macronuclear) [Paramecium tetraurelia strain d4-2]